MSGVESPALLELLEPSIVDATVATCPLCLGKVGMDEATCSRCGASFEEDLAMCADCWSRVPISAERCRICGAVLVD